LPISQCLYTCGAAQKNILDRVIFLNKQSLKIIGFYSDFFSVTFHLLDLLKNICDTLKLQVAETIQKFVYPIAFTRGVAHDKCSRNMDFF